MEVRRKSSQRMEDDSSLKRFAKVSRMFKKDGKKKMMNKEEDFQGLQRLGIKGDYSLRMENGSKRR